MNEVINLTCALNAVRRRRKKEESRTKSFNRIIDDINAPDLIESNLDFQFFFFWGGRGEHAPRPPSFP